MRRSSFSEPTHPVKVVNYSTPVKRNSQFGAIGINRNVISSRIATGDSTDALVPVTLNGRQVMVAPVPPAIPLPHPFIPTRLIEGVYQPEGYLQ